MLKVVQQGDAFPYKIDVVATAGQVVMLDAAAEGFVKLSAGVTGYGVVASDVIAFAAGEYRSLVKNEVAKGEGVTVYRASGIYKTDQYVDGTTSGAAYAPGQSLYVTTAGTLVNVLDTEDDPGPAATATTGVVAIGTVIEEGSGVLTFELVVPE